MSATPIDTPEPSASAGSAPTGRRLGPMLLSMAVVVISTGLSLTMAEIALRFMGFPATSIADPFADSQLGITMPRNYSEREEFEEYHGRYVEERTNSLGLLEDREIQPNPAPGVIRMAVLGDSQTACLCSNRESYAHVLEDLLNRSGGTSTYEVLNAGVGKYSPYQAYLKAKLQLVALKPRRLIVALYIGNDLVDLTREDDRPYLVLRSDGGIEAHPPHFMVYRDPAAPRTWLESLRLFALVKQKLGYNFYYQVTRARMLVWNLASTGSNPFRAIRYLMRTRDLTAMGLNMMTQSLHQYTWFQTFPSALPAALRLNEEVMRRFKQLCDENGIQLTYLILPAKIQIEPEDMQDILAKVEHYDPSLSREKQIAFSDFYAQEILKSAGRLGITVIDPREELRAAKNGKPLYYHADMHLNPDGNRALAAILARHLEAAH